MRKIKVWDLPRRLFHWLLVGFVVFSWATGEEAEEAAERKYGGKREGAGQGFEGGNYGAAQGAGEGSFGIHEVAGYAVLALLFFRMIWGLVGGEHARFWDFIRGGRTLRDYAAKLFRFSPPSSLGHNPLGGWMIVLLLVTLGAIIATGIFAEGEGEAVAELHAGLTDFLIGLVAVHILGVIAGSLLTGDNLTRAMVTGDKNRPEDSPERDARESPLWLAALGFAASLAVLGYIIAMVGS